MDTSTLQYHAHRPTRVGIDLIGRVVAVSGSQATVELNIIQAGREHPSVGKFMGVVAGEVVIIGLVTEIGEKAMPAPAGGQTFRNLAHLDLLGEIRSSEDGDEYFQHGVMDYPDIGDGALVLSERELRLIYGGADADHAHVGELQQNAAIGVYINIDHLVSQHFAIVGGTGVGKSCGVTIILQKILDMRPNLRIFLVDAHSEYGHCFGEKAQVLTPDNLRLPFWLFNFEEIVDAFFGGQPHGSEEVRILSELIPLAKSAYLQDHTDKHSIPRKRTAAGTSFTADTPVPYRIEDLIQLLDERMGKLENRYSAMVYHKLIRRIETFRTHPRYSFMFGNANVGGDSMAEILTHLFRLPPEGKPMTVMQLAGFPTEVVESVVSVLCRMAFDFGLWSGGIAPLLFVCEEAHHYAPADKQSGSSATSRALARMAREGRKYGVYLGLVTQRPMELDPTILSQCSTFFVMRLSNDRDQSVIRSAVSDAAMKLLSFIPSLGTREVFTFGRGVALPTRMRFTNLPPERQPKNEAAGNIRSYAGTKISRDLVSMVIERWRASTMARKSGFDYENGEPNPVYVGGWSALS